MSNIFELVLTLVVEIIPDRLFPPLAKLVAWPFVALYRGASALVGFTARGVRRALRPAQVPHAIARVRPTRTSTPSRPPPG